MTLKDGTYAISSILPTNPVLDIAGPNPFANPLAGIICFTKKTIEPQSQQWQVTTLRPGVYSLQYIIGPCWITAPVDGGVAQVDTSRYDPNLATRWNISEADPSSGNYLIESVQFPGRVIDLDHASHADNITALLYPYHKQKNQLWQFTPVEINF
ncbi:uncharacterized protein TrAtP1_009945 [Trichoderma atroviride]|uniref:Ricin B lectin domain-containing protein n=1 Tax=Hypocrea atroviridis (strain ATCC 20476 / IMI 206040) TaxID=452589 RepID=G9NEA5_HYPAI|nr:uncharacterized protein TRIATDRAFT_303244 [Trichoderma atroviride IMI 206040]EHK51011.1 hypothetical protein TRIATDRAFT_303244 [Trichoderma atroviride IMI 206040]UKZ68927.1 hypothetical protein TrAtP1_009945 [Trichoderma atroviride]